MESGLSTDMNLNLIPKKASFQNNFCIYRGIPVLTLVNAILLVIPASFLLQDAWQGMGEDPGIRTYLFVNIIATTSIAIVVAVFQTMISTVIVMHQSYDMSGWYTSHIVISALLAVTSIFAFCNDIHKTFTGFTFTYTCILDSVFSLGLSILLMLPE
ncbi:unnamed protein product [Allacma fusca]|uniref:Uncharacterized protein n=1 Tax=Allacma fusca TaxID=39272 RepID=A0A8J2JH46_9HEXA|nr:unnamed protein product [Allacma fusca]